MKILIFAGGHGTRLWPISRQNSPKQFAQIFSGKSTFQLAVERVQDIFGIENIYVSTNSHFAEIVNKQAPQLIKENIILEPDKRDVAAAIGYALMRLEYSGYSGPVSIVWADHVMERTEEYIKALALGEELIIEDSNRFVFLAEKPRFPNHNLGWITVGNKVDRRNGIKISEFKKWRYRPELEECKKMFDEGDSFWNPGYFITSVGFVLGLFKEFEPEMFTTLHKIFEKEGNLESLYPTLKKISFDDAILLKVPTNQAIVLEVDMGWSDPGTLYAMKEALSKSQDENVIIGDVVDIESKDTIVYNDSDKKIVTTIGLDGMIVVNTDDTILILHKDNAHKVKDLVKKLEDNGYDKYL